MHFAQALGAQDGVSINVFGAGSYANGDYESTMVVCEYNTVNNIWKQITRPNHAAARRNAAFQVTQAGSTYIWGGSSEVLTGLPSNAPGYPFYWNTNVTIYDQVNGWIDGPTYVGQPRSNATMTEINNANSQLVIIGGASIDNNSAVDMVTNFPLANMSEIIVLDPRYSKWANVIAAGESPPPRKHHTTTLHPDGHTLIVIGGEFFNLTGAYLLNDVWTLDTSNRDAYTWKKIQVNGDAGYYRSNHTSILIDDQIWVIAGTNVSKGAVDIQLLNVSSWTWTSNYVSTAASRQTPYASLGGVKGLVGVVVGTVGGFLLIASCLICWWCRRKRVNPFSKKKQLTTLSEHDNMVFIPGHGDQPTHYNNNNSDNHTEINSKITSRPSMSTTTSGGLALTGVGGGAGADGSGDWSNTQHMNSFITNTTVPTTSNMMTNSYYIPQYTTGPVTTPVPGQYYNESYFLNNNSGYHVDNNNENNLQTPNGGFGSTTGAVYSTDSNRQSLWDNNSTQHQPQHMQFLPDGTQFTDHDFMLTPINQHTGSSRPISRLNQPQALQKPNEVDAVDPTSPATASTTVYTTSTNEENRSVTPGNSEDYIYRTSNNQN
ncbi:hypothetical protein HPULCUR_009765 [Helicostylum pulchrum]|uniref:Galactose oxidase n=1 Tax=Helicostylum pulchrum TaxID=562976 RepID=A0ABP9YCH2_9FUNG